MFSLEDHRKIMREDVDLPYCNVHEAKHSVLHIVGTQSIQGEAKGTQ